jgi:predicted membrane channel-forming protein YqfA (hemolysin III family)
MRAGFDAVFAKAEREADEASAAAAQSRAHLLAHAHAIGGAPAARASPPSEWEGHDASRPSGAARSTSTDALVTMLRDDPAKPAPRLLRAGPVAARSAAAGAATVGGGQCVDLYELDPVHRWWRVDNEYIYFGYRRPPPPKAPLGARLRTAAVSAVWPIHNQTANVTGERRLRARGGGRARRDAPRSPRALNPFSPASPPIPQVWTHLAGACLVALLGSRTLSADGPMRTAAAGARTADGLDLTAMLCLVCGGLCCLTLSATFHLFCDVSLRLRRVLLKLDFAGVLSLVWGSWMPLLRFGLSCRDPRWAVTYCAVTTLLVVTVLVLCLLPRFATPAYQPVRAAVFLALGWFGAVPAAQLMLDPRTRPVGLGVLWMGLLYSAGTAIDVLRVPERFFFEKASPNLVLAAVGGACGGGDDGTRGSHASALDALHGGADGDGTRGSHASALDALHGGADGDGTRGSHASALHALHGGADGDGGGGGGGGGGSGGLISPSLSWANLGGGSSAQLSGIPSANTVTVTIMSSVTVTIMSSGSAVERVRGGLAREAGGGGGAAGGASATAPPPPLAHERSLLDRVQAAQRAAAARLGRFAPLLCVWGSHATFHCFVVAALVTHLHTSLHAWKLKAAGCPAH